HGHLLETLGRPQAFADRDLPTLCPVQAVLREISDKTPGRFKRLSLKIGAQTEVMRIRPDLGMLGQLWDRRASKIQVLLLLKIGQHIDPLKDHADLSLPETDPGVEVLRRRRIVVLPNQIYTELERRDIFRTVQDTVGVI